MPCVEILTLAWKLRRRCVKPLARCAQLSVRNGCALPWRGWTLLVLGPVQDRIEPPLRASRREASSGSRLIAGTCDRDASPQAWQQFGGVLRRTWPTFLIDPRLLGNAAPSLLCSAFTTRIRRSSSSDNSEASASKCWRRIATRSHLVMERPK